MKMQAADYFPMSARRVDNRAVRVRRLECSKCPTFAEVVDNGRVELPPEMVRKKFLQRNWEIGRDRQHDVCPDCAEADRKQRRAAARKEPTLKLVDTKPATNVAAASAEKPAQMSTDDRRVIFTKVSEVWAGADAGYSAPWTDSAVARDLGVPRAWVEEVRSQFFGEAKDNSEIKEFLTKLATVEATSKTILRKAEDHLALCQRQFTETKNITNDLQTCRRTLEGLHAIAQRIERAVT